MNPPTFPKQILKKGQLHPDGLILSVNWEKMEVGASVFIPCVNSSLAVVQVKKFFSTKKWRMVFEVRIENLYFGVRIWRTL